MAMKAAALRNESPSFLKRIRTTPKSIRKKLGLSQPIASAHYSSTRGISLDGKMESKHSETTAPNNFDFSCRYLGQRTVYTLNPTSCYEFGEEQSTNIEEKTLPKSIFSITSRHVEISHKTRSPTLKARPKFTSVSAHSPSLFRKRSNTATPPQPIHFNSTSHLPTAAQHAQYAVLCKRVQSAENIAIAQDSNNNSHLSHLNYNATSPRLRSNTTNSYYGSVQQLSEPTIDTVLLHEIAYCVTVPGRPRVFLLTSRGKEGLNCRAFLFSTREKAQAVKLALAKQFQAAFAEWQQSQVKQLRLSRDVSSDDVFEKPRPTRHITQSSLSDEDENESPSQVAMHREFVRRSSCLHNPDELVVGENIVQLERSYGHVLNARKSQSSPYSSSEEEH